MKRSHLNLCKLRSIVPVLLLSAASAWATDVREGLVSYWPLDTADFVNFPNTTPDVVGGNNMQLYDIFDSSAFVPGKFGQALSFDASQSQCAFFTGDVTQDTGLPITRNPSYSILLWVKADGVGQHDLRYFSESDVTNANNNPLYSLGSDSGGANAGTRIYLRNSTGTQLVSATVTNAVLDGAWHHIAMTYDAGNLDFYEDGQLVYTNTYTRDATGVWDTTSIGAIVRAAIDHYMTCTVDDVAVWARALSQGEIQDVMTNSIQTPVPAFAPGFSVSPAGATNLYVGDSWTFTGAAYGTRPLTYQWIKDGADVAGATDLSLTLTNLATGDSGDYALVAANVQGKATSVVATLLVSPWPAANLTNSLISYWPLDTVAGTKTPDVVSGYDMTLVNMSTANLVPGRWGQAMGFTNEDHTILERIDNPGEDLPIYNKPSFTISMWVNGDPNQTDRRVWSEGSTGNNNPLFNLGTDHTGGTGELDSYIRNDSGATSGDHHYSVGIVFDDTWHNIAYVQRAHATSTNAAWYIDGVLDPTVPAPVWPLTANTTSIGGILRSTPSSWFSGLIDEVAVWDRALSPDELKLLQVTSITNAPTRVEPLAINSFQADLPAVVSGGSTVLRWSVSKDASQLTITPGLGDVTAKTIVGVGTNAIVLTNSTTYVLTVQRGTSSLSATTAVAVVSGVAPGWTLLDNFDTYNVGPLNQEPYWNDLRGNSVQITNLDANKVMTTLAADSDGMLALQTNTLQENQSGTLFFRMILPAPDTNTPVHIVGLSDLNARGYGDIAPGPASGFGPAVYPTVMADPASGTNAWFLGARNGQASPMDYTASPLTPGAIYDVWIDITNTPMNDPLYGYIPDTFSVYLQKEGDPSRTLVFDSYLSDRDPYYVDVILGGMQPNLDKLYVAGDNASSSALFDDFYLSHGAYNSTVPRAFGYTGATSSSLQIQWAGTQLQINWTAGTLQQATSLTGPWSDVQGAAAPSYMVTPSGTSMFFRTRQ
jgi:Concanavalin A-like lectin/glucanases superfamily